MDPETFPDVWRGVTEWEPNSCDLVYWSYHPAVTSSARRLGVPAHDADPVANHVFFRLFVLAKAGRFTVSHPAALRRLLETITIFVVLDWRRRELNNPLILLTDDQLKNHAAALAEIPEEERTTGSRVADALHAALEKISDEDRLILELKLLDHQSTTKIARRLGLKRNTLCMRVQRALKKLRTILGDEFFPAPAPR